jgi:hypothetical protein
MDKTFDGAHVLSIGEKLNVSLCFKYQSKKTYGISGDSSTHYVNSNFIPLKFLETWTV